jgi:hypothetical protein
MLKNVKENSELLAKARQVNGDGKLPPGILLKTVEETKSEVNQFIALKRLDKDNEKFPINTYKKREESKQ